MAAFSQDQRGLLQRLIACYSVLALTTVKRWECATSRSLVIRLVLPGDEDAVETSRGNTAARGCTRASILGYRRSCLGSIRWRGYTTKESPPPGDQWACIRATPPCLHPA